MPFLQWYEVHTMLLSMLRTIANFNNLNFPKQIIFLKSYNHVLIKNFNITEQKAN